MNPSKGPSRLTVIPRWTTGFPLSIHNLCVFRPHHSKTRGADPKDSTPHVRGAVLRAGEDAPLNCGASG